MKQDRHNQIIELMVHQRTVTHSDLMERFGISIETVRRDLECLEQQGYLRRVYGGAVLNTSLNSEPEYSSRARLQHREKQVIATLAASLVKPTDSVYLGVGTTVQAMAPHLKKISGLTVFTNALRTATEISENPGCTVILPGGQLRPKELTLSSFPAEENLSRFNVDKAFIGIGGITEEGVTDFHIGEAQLHRQLIRNARESIVLADSSKLGIRAMTNICPLEEIDILITDSHATKSAIKAIEQAGVKVLLAKV